MSDDFKIGIAIVVTILICTFIIIIGVKSEGEIIDTKPTDTKFTPSYESIETDYEYKWSWWDGDFKLMPNVHTVVYPDKYEVEYIVYYDNGNNIHEWRTVSKEEYETALNYLGGADLR